MSQVVDHLAELTGYRDRDVLDVTLVGALREMLHPRAVAIYRCVGDAGAERWLTRARQRHDEAAASADPLWTELDTLPPASAHPLREQCWRMGQVYAELDAVTTTCFPMSTDREVAGVLEIETDQPLSRESQQLVAGILKVYRNFLGLLDYSERDTLTGLLNRKTFDDAFLRSAAVLAPGSGTPMEGEERRHRSGAQSWLGVIDIDLFKSVNDNYGHLIGDEVLLLLSRLMRGCFRLHDQLYRFGGEEFVVLLRARSDADCGAAFERLRQTVQGYAFPQVGRITVSVGYTRLRAGDSPAGAFERADKAVYHAKQTGRNRVESHQALVDRGVFADDLRESDVELF
ncbi:MAG: GGDEF domain-containing protein [Rubrivivax sp.]|nr:GGDEF domain-containing protein [Rubrivivax sp.]